MDNTDPIQVAKLFSDCGRAFPFYGIPAKEIPESPFFSHEFQVALLSGIRIARNSAAILDRLLVRQTRRERTGSYGKQSGEWIPSTKTIAFLGNSEAGKSSVINALLDFPSIAATGNIGSAITTVVTEYRQKDLGQTQRIKIEVEYLSKSASREHIKELLWSYRRRYLPDIPESSSSATESKPDDAKFAVESEQALVALKAAFGSEEGFNLNFLGDQSEGALERITDQLIQWSANIPWPSGNTDGKWTTYAENADECYELTKPFVRGRLWPFARIIRVYIDAPILRVGFVIADLPGLQDTNLARVKAAQEYLTKCDHIFVVASISRALTDESLRTSLHSAKSSFAPANGKDSEGKVPKVGVICTKTDIIDVKSTERELGSESDFPVSRIKGLNSAIEKASSQAHRNELEKMRELLCIEARNRHVEKGLKSLYENSVDGELKVFCVSNTTYEKSAYQQETVMDQRLRSVSGIPDLRKFCYFLSADSRLRDAKSFLQVTLPSLIASISMHCKDEESLLQKPGGPIKFDSSGIAETRDAILCDLEKAERNLETRFKHQILDFSGRILSQYTLTELTITPDKNHAQWQEAATKRGLDWLDWTWANYRSCCLNNGRYVLSTGKSVDWNSELIAEMRAKSIPQWDGLEDDLPGIFEDLCTSIQYNYIILKFRLGAHGFPSKLAKSLDHQLEKVNFQYEKSQQDFKSEIRSIRVQMLESNEASFIVQEMIPAYRAVVTSQGPQNDKARRDIVQDRIKSGTLFPNIICAVSNGMTEVSRRTFDEMANIIGEVFKSIERDVYSATSQKEQENQDGDGRQNAGSTSEIELLRKLRKLRDKHAMILRMIACF
ncbi:Nuclear GTPase SLIP-GC [Penicillium rolfsii]|nr:Nuclear GTPase SLIP-GC [Penicillium rolfsii]